MNQEDLETLKDFSKKKLERIISRIEPEHFVVYDIANNEEIRLKELHRRLNRVAPSYEDVKLARDYVGNMTPAMNTHIQELRDLFFNVFDMFENFMIKEAIEQPPKEKKEEFILDDGI